MYKRQAISIHKGQYIEVFSDIIPNNIQPNSIQIELYFKPSITISDLKPLCAVTKTQKLTLGQLYPLSNTIPMGSISKQNLKITGSGKLKLRVKLNFEKDDDKMEINDQFDHKFDQVL